MTSIRIAELLSSQHHHWVLELSSFYQNEALWASSVEITVISTSVPVTYLDLIFIVPYSNFVLFHYFGDWIVCFIYSGCSLCQISLLKAE